ncbi:MAG: hypothetical protein WC444_04895 [Candidatus Paceibacterota bacterium]
MNLKLARRYLDFAATEMDQKGHKDLADRIDKHVERLASADQRMVDLIVRDLKKIARESNRRDRGVDEDASERTDERPSRLSALRRRLALRKRLAARREPLSERRLASLRSRRKARMEEYGDDGDEDRSTASDRLRRSRLARRIRARRERDLE